MNKCALILCCGILIFFSPQIKSASCADECYRNNSRCLNTCHEQHFNDSQKLNKCEEECLIAEKACLADCKNKKKKAFRWAGTWTEEMDQPLFGGFLRIRQNGKRITGSYTNYKRSIRNGKLKGTAGEESLQFQFHHLDVSSAKNVKEVKGGVRCKLQREKYYSCCSGGVNYGDDPFKNADYDLEFKICKYGK